MNIIDSIKFRFRLAFTKIEQVQITHRVDLDQEKVLMDDLKKMQFVETVKDGWTREFTNVLITDTAVFIGHKVDEQHANANKKTMVLKITKVNNPLLTIREWIKYFDRI